MASKQVYPHSGLRFVLSVQVRGVREEEAGGEGGKN